MTIANEPGTYFRDIYADLLRRRAEVVVGERVIGYRYHGA